MIKATVVGHKWFEYGEYFEHIDGAWCKSTGNNDKFAREYTNEQRIA